MKVLVIEDDTKSRRYLLDVIASAGHETVGAADGLLGLQAFEDFKPDLVLCDIQMPHINGLEVLLRLRQKNSDLFVVMMTAYGSEEYAIEALRKGANDYLKKPVRFKELSMILEKYAELSIGNGPTEDAQSKARLLNINLSLQQELKNQAELLVQYEKMSSIGTITSSIAHEISNSMISVVGNLSFLTGNSGHMHELMDKYNAMEMLLSNQGNHDAVTGLVDDLIKEGKLSNIIHEVGEFANQAMEGAMQVDTLLRDLKGFSRLEIEEYTSVDLNERLDFVLKMMRTRIKRKISVKREYGELPPIHCSPQKIGQVLLNLLLNAEQSIKEQGTITLTTSIVPSEKDPDKHLAKLVIADTGQGISPENLKMIFHPFFTTKPPGEGTGLGLKITQDIIHDHGGNIAFSSQEGAGTTVTVTLPLQDEGNLADTQPIAST